MITQSTEYRKARREKIIPEPLVDSNCIIVSVEYHTVMKISLYDTDYTESFKYIEHAVLLKTLASHFGSIEALPKTETTSV